MGASQAAACQLTETQFWVLRQQIGHPQAEADGLELWTGSLDRRWLNDGFWHGLVWQLTKLNIRLSGSYVIYSIKRNASKG